MARAEDEQKKMQEEFEKTKESLDTMEKKYKLLEERCVMLDREKDELKTELSVCIYKHLYIILCHQYYFSLSC